MQNQANHHLKELRSSHHQQVRAETITPAAGVVEQGHYTGTDDTPQVPAGGEHAKATPSSPTSTDAQNTMVADIEVSTRPARALPQPSRAANRMGTAGRIEYMATLLSSTAALARAQLGVRKNPDFNG